MEAGLMSGRIYILLNRSPFKDSKDEYRVTYLHQFNPADRSQFANAILFDDQWEAISFAYQLLNVVDKYADGICDIDDYQKLTYGEYSNG